MKPKRRKQVKRANPVDDKTGDPAQKQDALAWVNGIRFQIAAILTDEGKGE